MKKPDGIWKTYRIFLKTNPKEAILNFLLPSFAMLLMYVFVRIFSNL